MATGADTRTPERQRMKLNKSLISIDCPNDSAKLNVIKIMQMKSNQRSRNLCVQSNAEVSIQQGVQQGVLRVATGGPPNLCVIGTFSLYFLNLNIPIRSYSE